jgi:DNA-binding CsgD family transcriptional regulator
MTSFAELSELVGSIYDAGMNPARWTPVLDDIARALGSMRADLWVGAPTGRVRAIDFIGIAPEFRATYEQHFGHIDPIFWPVTMLPQGTVLTDSVVPRVQLERSEFYQDWVRPQDMHSIAVVNFMRTDAISGVIGLPRTARGRPFEGEDLLLLQTLLPHLRRAVNLQLRLDTLAGQERVTSAALDALRHAIAIVDDSCRPLFLNRAARQIIARKDGLTLNANKLCASTNRLTQMLHALVARATGTSSQAFGGAMALMRPSGKRTLNALVARLGSDASWPDVPESTRAALILISDTAPDALAAEDILISLYGLTPSEARIAGRLGRGDSLATVADSLGVLTSTARTHLHHAFAKTSTQRQSELARLVEQAAILAKRSDEDRAYEPGRC